MIQTVEYLISRGHRYEDVIYKYSYDLILKFDLASQKNSALKTLTDFTMLNMAHNADSKILKEYVGSLKNIIFDKKKHKENNGISKEKVINNLSKLRNLLNG